ncbi:MAG: polyprenyl synthetase family protein [Spirochaetaceae bacterium]
MPENIQVHTTISTLYKRIELAEELQTVRGIISAEIRGGYPFIEEALQKFISTDGKLLRPALLLLSSRFGEKSDSALYLAAAVEILHMATLVHDDIIDRSSTRRGKPTLNALYGEKKAVLLGDYLFSRSFSLASTHTDTHTGGFVAGCVGSICDSEIRQNAGSYDFSIGFKEYHRRIMGKTAALFAVSTYLGAKTSGLDERDAARLRKIGYNFGAAFQIVDDILDCTVNDGRTGKTSGTDIREGVINLPLLCALHNDNGTLRKLILKKHRSEGKVKRVLLLIRELGGVEKARSIADRYMDKAQESINLLPESDAKNHIAELAGFLLKRTY